MALKYDKQQILQRYIENARQFEEIYKSKNVDLVFLDMLGYFIWQAVGNDVLDEDIVKGVVMGSILAAYVAGYKADDKPDLPDAFFELISQLDMGNDIELKDTMNW